MSFIKIDDTLVLGEPETAVRSCVQLMSMLFAQPVDQTAYYLDLYYQVRLAYERSKAANALFHIPQPSGPIVPGYPDPPRSMNKPTAPEAEEDVPSQSPVCALVTAPPEGGAKGNEEPQGGEGEETAREEKFAEVLASVNAGEAQRKATRDHVLGNHHAAEAAAEKRRIKERLDAFRANGVSVKQIVRAADGNITEDEIREILESRKVPIAVYRVLEAALETLAAAPPEK